MTEQPVVVTQEAREAAEAARAWCDDMDEPEMVQAFARFEHEIRLSTEAEKTKAVEEAYRQGVKDAAELSKAHDGRGDTATGILKLLEHPAIRSRKSGR
jgi:hypothetical protein